MMNGSINVDSVYGQGTTFTVIIPKVLGNESDIKHYGKEKRKYLSAPDAKVLVVDDTEVNLKVALGLLNLCQDCINIEIAMSRVSGMEDMYREALETFYSKLISECDKMEKYISSIDLHNFTIAVHGVKSSLSTIGAIGFSEIAANLEEVAKKGDFDYCKDNLPQLITKLKTLHNELSVIFPKEMNVQKEEGNAEILKEKVMEAIAVAQDFDDVLGAQIIDELLKFDFGNETNKLLEDAKNAFKDFECDMASEYLNKINLVI